MANVVVLYHAGCPDGFGAAFFAWLAFKEQAVYIPCSYGSKVPNINTGTKTVYILDFSFPEDILDSWVSRGIKVILLDHHKSAQETIGHLPYCHFDMSKSGAMLSFNHFFPKADENRLALYLQDRDLWQNELPHTTAINNYINSLERDFITWGKLSIDLVANFDRCLDQGTAISRYISTSIDFLVAPSKVMFATFLVGDKSYSVPTVNTPMFQSEVGNTLCQKYSNYEFSATYFDRADRQRQWGLRSIGDFDVKNIAVHFGGGGHKNASGFVESRPLKLIKFIK